MLLKKSSNKVYFDYNKRLGHFESDRRFVSVRWVINEDGCESNVVEETVRSWFKESVSYNSEKS